jgi:2-keto-4-pentenoate hydratase
MPLSDPLLKLAVQHIRQGHSRPPIPIGHLPEGCQPSDVRDAMAIQDRLNESLTADGHGEVVGTKIGCTTQVMQEFLGMTHPCAGAIFATTVRHVDGEFDFASFLHVGVECEIAVTLRKTIRKGAAPHTLASVSECVRDFFPAIEVVDDRYVDMEARVPDWRTWLADNFFGAGIVLGRPVANWRDLDLAAIRGVMRINGDKVGAGHGRDIINGHPLEALVWLANFEAARGRDIPAGWIVMLGSIVQTNWVAQGDTVDVQIEALGTATARFL